MTELSAHPDGHADVRAGPAPAIVAAVATVVALVLVLVRLGDKSLWHDEGASVGLVDRSIGDALWRMAHWEANQSFFYLLFSGWWRLGQSETFLRLLPAAFAVAAVPALYDLGRRLVGARAGAVASVLLAVHPLSLEWGQQVRGYSLVLLLSILSTTLLLRAAEAPDSTARAIAYGATAALATYTHFFAGLVIATHVLWLLLQRPRPRRTLVSAGVTYALLVSPLVLYLLTRDGDPIQWVGEVGTRSAIRSTAMELTGGTRWSVAAYTVAVAAGIWAVGFPRRTGSRDLRSPAVLPVMWLLLPVAAVTLSTMTVKPLLQGRFLIVVVPALALLAATGICRVPRPAATGLLAALVVLSAVGIERWYTRPSNEDWRTVTVLVAEAAGPDAKVVMVPFGGSFVLQYYEDRLGVDVPMFISPYADDLPIADPLIEVRGRTLTGDEVRLPPSYATWRDHHYSMTGESFIRGVVVRVYEPDRPR